MQTLTQLGGDAVPALIEGLDSPDAFLRRNVALTLGYIGDPRANGVLAAHAASDPDPSAQAAAGSALARCGGNADAHAQLLAQGDAYHNRRADVLMPHQVSDVIWMWSGNGLASVEVPAFLYHEEMAKKAFYRALAVNPGSTAALAGIVRVSAASHSALAERAARGADVSGWQARLAEDDLAIQVAGSDALDMALGWALDQHDQAAATGLCRALNKVAAGPTPNLVRALGANGAGAVRGEAAVALGHIAFHTNADATAVVVDALAESASREVLRIVTVVDGDDSRRSALESALTAQGAHVNAWPTGSRALAAMRQIPGVDAIVVAASLPDLTFDQVYRELKSDPKTANTPILRIGADDGGYELAGVISGADAGAVIGAMGSGMNADREEADALAANAASMLARLAGGGRTDVSSSANALAGTLAMRPDAVTIPALKVLRAAGSSDHVAAVAAVLTDGGRSDAAREEAGKALGGIFVRGGMADAGTRAALLEVATSDATFSVRKAAAVAAGRLALSADERASLMGAVRAKVTPE
jgi:CheY-like chemotaxis protein